METSRDSTIHASQTPPWLGSFEEALPRGGARASYLAPSLHTHPCWETSHQNETII